MVKRKYGKNAVGAIVDNFGIRSIMNEEEKEMKNEEG